VHDDCGGLYPELLGDLRKFPVERGLKEHHDIGLVILEVLPHLKVCGGQSHIHLPVRPLLSTFNASDCHDAVGFEVFIEFSDEQTDT
jgi:hypothetical protein